MGNQEKAEVKGYFETTGFERWNRIYSTSGDVNRVQRNIRIGHQKTVDNVLAWLQEDGDLASRSFCDAGCGVGSLSLPLAQLGAASIAASDISEAMVKEATGGQPRQASRLPVCNSAPPIWKALAAPTTQLSALMCLFTIPSPRRRRWLNIWQR